MTPDQFRAALATCGWSARQVASMTGRAQGAGTDWLAGRRKIPADVAHWLQQAAAWHKTNPAPKRAA